MPKKTLLASAAFGFAIVALAPPLRADEYTYDELGRLTQVDFDDGQVIKYDYDPAGNRTLVRQGGGPDPTDDETNVAEDTAKDINVLANDSDLNGDSLSIYSVTTPAHGTTSIIEVSGDDWIRYTPDTNSTAPDSFSYTITDGTSNASADVDITMISDNDAPVADNESPSTNEDTFINIDALDGDVDPDSDPLEISSVSTPAHGTAEVVTVSGEDQIKYTPAANYYGSDSFTYDASDGTLSDSGTVNVTVNSVNDTPVANTDSFTTNEDTQHTLDPRTNDTDVETAYSSLTITAKTNGSKGTVEIISSGTQLRYTPNANQNGSDSFTYTVSDGSATANGTVNVTITAVNDAPDAVNDSKSTNEDTTLDFDPRTNDTEPDGQSFTITAKTNGSKGEVSIISSGTQLRYVPTANQNGSDSFTYTISDGSLTDTATVSMTINAVNDPPTPYADEYYSVSKTAWTTFSVRSNDSDPDGNTLTVSAVSPGYGLVEIINSGADVRYKCKASGTCPINDDEFTYQVSDGNGGSEWATVFVAFYPYGFPPP